MIEITEKGKRVTFGFRCPVCGQKWRADAINCNTVGVDEEDTPTATMECDNCGTFCNGTNFLKEER